MNTYSSPPLKFFIRRLFVFLVILNFAWLSALHAQPPCKVIVKNYLDCDPELTLKLFQVINGVPTLIESVPLPINPGSWNIPYIDTFDIQNGDFCNNCDPIVYQKRIFRNDTERTDSNICCYKCYVGSNGQDTIVDSCNGCCGKIRIICEQGMPLKISIGHPETCPQQRSILKRKEEELD